MPPGKTCAIFSQFCSLDLAIYSSTSQDNIPIAHIQNSIASQLVEVLKEDIVFAIVLFSFRVKATENLTPLGAARI